MKILLIDREDITARLIKSRLEPLGHSITVEPSKNDAVDLLSSEPHDMIFLDPAPLTSARPLVLNIRRSVGNYPYVVLMGDVCDLPEAIKAGANDCIAKPMDPIEVDEKVQNAAFFSKLVRRIGDDSEDFPSAGGVIAKSAFNQLFLSAIDRADRYGERSFVLFISIDNYSHIYQTEGPYAADYIVAKLCQYLVRWRRQSDIIGQTSAHEYALLLQRPVYETEPGEAANRFAQAITGCKELFEVDGGVKPVISVTLVDLPVGSRPATYKIDPSGKE